MLWQLLVDKCCPPSQNEASSTTFALFIHSRHRLCLQHIAALTAGRPPMCTAASKFSGPVHQCLQAHALRENFLLSLNQCPMLKVADPRFVCCMRTICHSTPEVLRRGNGAARALTGSGGSQLSSAVSSGTLSSEWALSGLQTPW